MAAGLVAQLEKLNGKATLNRVQHAFETRGFPPPATAPETEEQRDFVRSYRQKHVENAAL